MNSNPKDFLKRLMTNFEGSFVGFYNLTAEILEDLGNEWKEHAELNSDVSAAKWASSFKECASSIRNVADLLANARYEYDLIENAKEGQDPSVLVKSFKEAIKKQIKNA